MALSDLVNISVAVKDAAPSTPNFGTPMILTGQITAAGKQSFNADATATTNLVAAGAAAGTSAYRMAQAGVSQPVHCQNFIVGKRAHPNAQTLSMVPGFVTGQTYTMSVAVDGGAVTVLSRTVPGTPTLAAECAAWATLLTISGITTSATNTEVDFHPTTTNTRIWINQISRELVVEDTSADAGIASDLDALYALSGNPFFGVLLDSQSPAEIEAAAVWCMAHDCILGFVANSGKIWDPSETTTNALSVGSAATQHNAFGVATRDGMGCAHAALMFRQLALNPGTSNWANKQLSGPIADSTNATEFGAVQAKHGINYQLTNGLGITYDGWAMSGRYLDITHGALWLKSALQIAVFLVFVNNETVPYTADGVALIESAVRGVFAESGRRGFTSNLKLTVPVITDQMPVDVAKRILRNFNWTATLNGAIDQVTGFGTLLTS